MTYRKRNMTDAEMKEWLETQYDANENGCWVWRGMKEWAGYGSIKYHGKFKKVHRLYWLLLGRTIPEGLDILHGHGCSKACYNPEHLHTGTHSENMLDRHRDGTMTSAILTPEQVLEIRARTDKNQKDLAEEYDVSRATICLIMSGKNWGWL